MGDNSEQLAPNLIKIMDDFDDDEDDFLLSIPLEEQSTGTNDVYLAFINQLFYFTMLG